MLSHFLIRWHVRIFLPFLELSLFLLPFEDPFFLGATPADLRQQSLNVFLKCLGVLERGALGVPRLWPQSSALESREISGSRLVAPGLRELSPASP